MSTILINFWPQKIGKKFYNRMGKVYYKIVRHATIIKMLTVEQKRTDKQNGLKNPETQPSIYNNLVYEEGSILNQQGRMNVYFIKVQWFNSLIIQKKNKISKNINHKRTKRTENLEMEKAYTNKSREILRRMRFDNVKIKILKVFHFQENGVHVIYSTALARYN